MYQLIPEEQARALGEKVSAMKWAQGKARTESLTGTVKRNSEILSHPSLQLLGKRIVNHPEIQMDWLPKQAHPPKYSRYQEGEEYQWHTDAPWMAGTRTDMACTLWLNDEYEGGELEVEGVLVRGKPGKCAVYNCGEPHRVLSVKHGERICAITWLQSRVRDPLKRRLVSDLRRAMSKFEDQPYFLDAAKVHSGLLRMWAE